MGFVEDDDAVKFAGDDEEFLTEESINKFEELNKKFKLNNCKFNNKNKL